MFKHLHVWVLRPQVWLCPAQLGVYRQSVFVSLNLRMGNLGAFTTEVHKSPHLPGMCPHMAHMCLGSPEYASCETYKRYEQYVGVMVLHASLLAVAYSSQALQGIER